MPVKKKSRVTSRRNSRKPNNHAGTSQNSSRRLSAPSESQPGSHRPSSSLDRGNLWIAEKTSLTRQQDAVAWGSHAITGNDARLLELADIALGLRKPESFRRRKSSFLDANRSSLSMS